MAHPFVAEVERDAVVFASRGRGRGSIVIPQIGVPAPKGPAWRGDSVLGEHAGGIESYGLRLAQLLDASGGEEVGQERL